MGPGLACALDTDPIDNDMINVLTPLIPVFLDGYA
jgi:hypothetical protein